MHCKIAVSLTVFLTGGCAIRPLPQDVTGIDTYAIVSQFRCEMRSALQQRVLNAIRKRPSDAFLAEELQSQRLPYSQVVSLIKDRDLKGVLEQYAGATIIHDFSFNMTEINSFKGDLNITRPLGDETGLVGIALSSDHKRQNTRTLKTTDTFERLLSFVDDNFCSGINHRPNYDYPVEGKTMVEDMVLTFLDLNQSQNLSGKDAPTLTDDLQFTTKYEGSVSPLFTRNPLDEVIRLTRIGGTLGSSREDLHRVTIVLALPAAGSKPTPLTIAETRDQAERALADAKAERTQINIERIADRVR